MAEENLASFDDKRIEQAIETAQRHSERMQAVKADGPVLADGALTVAAECVSVTVKRILTLLRNPSSKMRTSVTSAGNRPFAWYGFGSESQTSPQPRPKPEP